MPLFDVTMTGQDVEKQDKIHTAPDGTEFEVERGVDGKHIRIITLEANNEKQAARAAVKQAEDIATQEAFAQGLELDLEIADFVEQNSFQVHSVEKAKGGKRSSDTSG